MGAARGQPWLCLAAAPALGWRLGHGQARLTCEAEERRGSCHQRDRPGSTCPCIPLFPPLNSSTVPCPSRSRGCAKSRHKLQLARRLTASRQLTSPGPVPAELPGLSVAQRLPERFVFRGNSQRGTRKRNRLPRDTMGLRVGVFQLNFPIKTPLLVERSHPALATGLGWAGRRRLEEQGALFLG